MKTLFLYLKSILKKLLKNKYFLKFKLLIYTASVKVSVKKMSSATQIYHSN